MADRKNMICRQHVESLFLYWTAPILRDIKPAVLIRIKSECIPMWKNSKKTLCEITELKMIEIHNKEDSVLFLIYDSNKMNKVLKAKESASILSKYGYILDSSTEDMLSYLKSRFISDEFPHEIGLFLGYPPDDVKAFIDNEGKNSICCRYWKVYNNVEKAQEIFKKIDDAQNYAIDILNSLQPIHIAANTIKVSQHGL